MSGPFDLYGINISAWNQNGFADASLVNADLDAIKATGANSVTIDYGVYFNANGSIVPASQNRTPPLADLANVIAGAQARGLTVYLKPHPADTTSGGNLNYFSIDWKQFSTDQFFAGWKGYLSTLADFASQNHVNGIFIGTEDSGLDSANRNQWADIISTVRQKFLGTLTYDALVNPAAVNLGVNDVVFWDLLDFISVSLYMPLSHTSQVTVSQLNQSWLHIPAGDIGNVVEYLHSVATRFGKQVFIGETAISSNSQALWGVTDPSTSNVPDNQAQVLGLESLFDTFTKYKGDWLKGLNLWGSNPWQMSTGGLIEDWTLKDQTTYGKPGNQVVIKWFTGAATYSDPNYAGQIGNDNIVGGDGNDIIRGGAGSDTLKGGIGDDTICGNGLTIPESTTIKIWAGADILNNIGPVIDIVLDGVTVLTGHEVRMASGHSGPGAFSEEIDVVVPYKTKFSSLDIVWTNTAEAGRSLYFIGMEIDGITIPSKGNTYHPAFNLPPQPDVWGGGRGMGAGGYLSINLDSVIAGKQQATTDNNFLEGGPGNDTLIGGDGTDTAVFSGLSRSYQLVFANGSWTVQDKTGTDGTDTLTNIHRLQFTDKTVITDSKAPGSYIDLPESLWHFCIVAFSAAPGVEYMNQMADAYRSGLSVQTIVDIFTSKNQFTDVYPTNLSHVDLASALVKNVVKGSASAVVKQGAIDDIVAALDIGWTVGKMIYTVFGNLASKPLDDPTWGNTAHQFQNEMAIAKYYTNIMDQSTTDLSTLRQVLAPVDQNTDVSTPEHIATLVGVALLA